ncbi:MAG: hypothetical protein FJ397_06730 [Verrucomicrobia bacterium]|nr:hypothetical protein [Verrucomicrobiota bacterium]
MADADLLADMLASAATKYDIKEQVGAGGMALVFKARDRATGETVAMKIIRPQLLSDDHARELFDREAKVTARLTHRNIVRVREVLPLAHGGQAIVMDFLSGVSLKHQLKSKGPLPFDRAVEILVDVAAALQYTHFGGLVHRDVKPENIFLDGKTGRALLTDFGIACSIGVPPSDPQDSTHGTPSYMSPEHIEGRPLHERSDIYSLGCVAYELLTGVPPWAGMTVGEVLERQRKDRIPPVHEIRRDIPALLEGVIARAVAKDPAERIPDAKAFAEALAPLAHASSAIARGMVPRQLIGVGVSVIGAVVLFLAGRSEGRSGTAAITVPVPVATVTIAPTSATVTVGGTQQLTATTRDASGNVLTGRTVTWTSSNTGVATVSTTGLVTAVAAGSATISATSEGRSGTAAITVHVSTSCSTANPPSDGQLLCTSLNYLLPTTTSATTREYLLSRTTSTSFTVTLTGGTGDADLYILNPAGSTVCSSITAGNNDSCTVTGSVGTWRIRVYAYSSYSGVTLRIQ